jgi:hypothetical protein
VGRPVKLSMKAFSLDLPGAMPADTITIAAVDGVPLFVEAREIIATFQANDSQLDERPDHQAPAREAPDMATESSTFSKVASSMQGRLGTTKSRRSQFSTPAHASSAASSRAVGNWSMRITDLAEAGSQAAPQP